MFVKIGNIPNENSTRCTPYYEKAIENIKRIHKMKNFPNVNSKEIYSLLLPNVQPKTEIEHPNYQWNKIWKCLNFKYINITDRNITYKFLHGILPNNKKLTQMKIKNSAKCNYCIDEDSHMHRFLSCYIIQKSITWLKNFIEDVCNIKVNNMQTYLMLDFPYINKKISNTLSVIICNYISIVWLNRENLEYIDKKVKAKIIRERGFLKYLLKDRFEKLFCIRYCEIEMNQMNYV